jgi:NAD(P)-dependent dehydrogenase (short-subunit alcohol dehydrogenase family)
MNISSADPSPQTETASETKTDRSTLSLKGKAALITGASRGIGRAIALKFAQAGARIAIHYHADREAALETLNMLPGDGHSILKADIASPYEVQQMVNSANAYLGGLDILVNNAGIYIYEPVFEMDYENWQAAWQRTLQVNLVGAANTSYCAAKLMIARGGGKIINISSRGAYRGEPRAPAYGASKAGLNALSQSLAQYLAPYNILVTTVAPGWVATDMAAKELAGPEGDKIRHQSPLGRVAQPEEIAHTVLFLAAPGSEFLTGGVIDVNGASYLH